MQNEKINKPQQKENLRVNVYQKDEHRGNSQKNPLMATRGKNVAEWSPRNGID